LKPKKKIEVVSSNSFAFCYRYFPKELKAYFSVSKNKKRQRPTLKELENLTIGKKNEEVKG
jgi:hypothetical protein